MSFRYADVTTLKALIKQSMNNNDMKKIFTLLTLFLLSFTIANAQNTNGSITNLDEQPLKKFSTIQTVSPIALKAKSSQKIIEMESSEHLVGFYVSDDLQDFTSGGLGIDFNPGQLIASVIFEDDVLNRYIGGEITKIRFALAADVPVAGVYIFESTTDYFIDDEPIVHEDLSSYTPVVGWNEVTLTTPLKIEEGKYYVVGFEYTQSSNSSDIECYPLATDATLDVDYQPNYGFLLYGDWTNSYGPNVTWLGLDSSYYGNLCIQAVVSGGNLLVDDDISISHLSVSEFGSAGEDINYSYYIMNEGNVMPTSYSLNACIDGTAIETLNDPVELINMKQKVEGTFTIPFSVSADKHKFSIEVNEINGNTPSQNTYDDVDETDITVYEGKVSRQMHLIEQFTSVQCTYCPIGHEILEALQELEPDKYAWVAIHGPIMGDDPFYLTDGSTDYLESFVMPTYDAYPSAAFNRYLFDDNTLNNYREIAMTLSYSSLYKNQVVSMFDDLINSVYDEIPAFATIGIETEYDESTRQLSIKVSGDGVNNANEILDGNRLTVYLTEDGLVATQLNMGVYEEDYVHDNVLRSIVSNEGYPWGDEINWIDDKTYENDYTVTLDDSWNANNMHVIAFISKSFMVETDGNWDFTDYSDGYVNNANMVKIGGSTTNIDNPISETNVTEASRYSTDGRQLSSPVKGLNIVKMSDGTARKVIVR